MTIEPTDSSSPENKKNEAGSRSSEPRSDALAHEQVMDLFDKSFTSRASFELESSIQPGVPAQITEGRWIADARPLRRVHTNPEEKFVVPNDTQALLFDFDGTLLRLEYTESIRQGAFRHVLARLARKFNLIMTDQEIESLHMAAFGRPEYEMSQVYAERLSDLVRANICRDKLHDFWATTCGEWLNAAAPEVHPASHIRDGIEAVMSEAKRRGIPMALVTSGHSSIVEPMIIKAGLQDYISLDASVFINQHHPGIGFKPAPDGYLLAFRKLGVSDPSKVIIFEDSATGALAGVRSGANVLLQPSEKYFETIEELCRTFTRHHPEPVISPAGGVIVLAENQNWHPVQFDAAQ
jgi:beta-phosphoglucomutase-like phosphatase (HAD superfamily)